MQHGIALGLTAEKEGVMYGFVDLDGKCWSDLGSSGRRGSKRK
jgi:hypothetical protein